MYYKVIKIMWVLCLAVMTLSMTVSYAAMPAGFSALGSSFNDQSDWIVKGKAITSRPGVQEKKFPLDPLSELMPEERSRGYVRYIRHYLDPITSSSRPLRSEIGSEAVIFASPGEYEPVSFSIFTMQPIHGATAVISDLIAPDGLKIPAENIDVRVVKRLVCTSEGDPNWFYYKPQALEKKNTADAGTSTPREG